MPATNGPIIICGMTAWILGGLLFFASYAPTIVFVIVALVFSGILLLLGSFAYASRHLRFEVTPEGLAIRGDLYGRRLPSGALLTGEARPVDLTENQDYAPAWRTNGAGFPGYSSGWFKLNNGDRALVFLTDKRRVVYLPTREGYAVLLSVPEPDRFLAVLKQMM